MKHGQFWAGTADREELFWALVEERDIWAEGVPEGLPISVFAEIQGEVWLDHDFVEGAFAEGAGITDIARRFAGMSWAAAWAPEVTARAAARGLASINTIHAVWSTARPGEPPRHQVAEPHDVAVDGVRLTYLGEIAHAG